MSIASVPIRYQGFQFRSKLEAIWARLFELYRETQDPCSLIIGIRNARTWTFEPYPIESNGQRCLPDFMINRTLAEVKPFTSLDAFYDSKIWQITREIAYPSDLFQSIVFLGTDPNTFGISLSNHDKQIIPLPYTEHIRKLWPVAVSTFQWNPPF